MSKSPALREIEQLDPRYDHQRIVFLSSCYDFPIEAAGLSMIVLLRAFGAPRISTILERSGEWSRNAAARSANLVRSIVSLVGHGYDSHVGRDVIRRMNAAHSRYRTANDEFVYLLSRFVFEPVAWNARFGWRPYCSQEREALFHFWTAVGRRMQVRDIPDTPASLEQFMVDYAGSQCRPDPISQRLFLAFREAVAGWMPPPARPIVRWIIPQMMDQDLREALLIPTPSRSSQAAGRAVLQTASRLMALSPRRTTAYPFRGQPPFLYGKGPRLLEDAALPEPSPTSRMPTLPGEPRIGRGPRTLANAERRP
jgi:hypothetical protein